MVSAAAGEGLKTSGAGRTVDYSEEHLKSVESRIDVLLRSKEVSDSLATRYLKKYGEELMVPVEIVSKQPVIYNEELGQPITSTPWGTPV
ncbi:MAG: hypothetical protein QW728_05295, partial [Thermoplasmata archaeon]